MSGNEVPRQVRELNEEQDEPMDTEDDDELELNENRPHQVVVVENVPMAGRPIREEDIDNVDVDEQGARHNNNNNNNNAIVDEENDDNANQVEGDADGAVVDEQVDDGYYDE